MLPALLTQVSAQAHPCPGITLPLTEERMVVQVGECLFQARVVKVDRIHNGGQTYYRVRLLSSDGRVRTIDLDSVSGMPVDPAVREEVNATFNR